MYRGGGAGGRRAPRVTTSKLQPPGGPPPEARSQRYCPLSMVEHVEPAPVAAPAGGPRPRKVAGGGRPEHRTVDGRTVAARRGAAPARHGGCHHGRGRGVQQAAVPRCASNGGGTAAAVAAAADGARRNTRHGGMVREERRKEGQRQIDVLYTPSCQSRAPHPIPSVEESSSRGAAPPYRSQKKKESGPTPLTSYSHTFGSSEPSTPLPVRTARRAAAMCGSSSSTGMMVGWPTPPGAVPSSSITAMAAS